jgi:hypothetical protein
MTRTVVSLYRGFTVGNDASARKSRLETLVALQQSETLATELYLEKLDQLNN